MLRETSVSVVRWARLLDVSTRGYYAWRRALPKRNAKERQYRQRIKHFFDQGRALKGPNASAVYCVKMVIKLPITELPV